MADVRGYSQLDGGQQRHFYQNIMPEIGELCRQCKSETINLQTWGDAIAVCSNEALSLATLALSLRDHFKKRQWAKDELPELDVRISLHLGEIYEGLNPVTNVPTVIGPSLVMAARVEPLVTPGQVWTTTQFKLALEELQRINRHYAFDDLGEMTLPKQFGRVALHLMRRAGEAPISNEQLAQIQAARSGTQAAAEHIAVGIVTLGGRIVVVKRRPKGQNDTVDQNLKVMFPSGRTHIQEDPQFRVCKEVKQETRLSCKVEAKLGTRPSPYEANKVLHYYHLVPFDDTAEPANGDPDENEEVMTLAPQRVVDLVHDLSPDVRKFLLGLPRVN